MVSQSIARYALLFRRRPPAWPSDVGCPIDEVRESTPRSGRNTTASLFRWAEIWCVGEWSAPPPMGVGPCAALDAHFFNVVGLAVYRASSNRNGSRYKSF